MNNQDGNNQTEKDVVLGALSQLSALRVLRLAKCRLNADADIVPMLSNMLHLVELDISHCGSVWCTHSIERTWTFCCGHARLLFGMEA